MRLHRTTTTRLAATAFVLLLSGAAPSATADDLIQISSTRKTGAKHTGESQKLAAGSTRLEEEMAYYTIELTPKKSGFPKTIRAEWQVLVEKSSGRIQVSAEGETQLRLKLNQTVSFDTEPTILTTREWKHWSGKGELEDKLKGFALRLYDPESGDLLQEKYQPPSVEKDIQWARGSEHQSSEELTDPVRQRFPRPDRQRERLTR